MLNASSPTTYTSPTAAKSSSSTTSKADMDMETFLNLLVVQLANQNPLDPMDDSQFFAQMAQLGQVQGMDKMQASLEVTQAADLMGKTVTAVRPMTDSGTGVSSTVTGKVVSLRIVDGERLLGLQESDGGLVEVKMENIQQIYGS